jgi:steroid 5-alpha reductase family enzyme
MNKTEYLFDLSGSLSFVAAFVLSYLLHKKDRSWRQLLATAFGCLWALRLGSYLFWRTLSMGGDRRFDDFKSSWYRFAVPWLGQIAWVFIVGLPIYVMNGNPGHLLPNGVKITDIVGGLIFVFGVVYETVADVQKSIAKKTHPGKFVSDGLYRYHRYPNYFGEIALWIGVLSLCSAGFVEPWQWISSVSPLFVFVLLRYVSGIPLTDASQAKRYGNLPEYKEYIKSTPLLLPKIS